MLNVNGVLIQTKTASEMVEEPTEYRGVAYGDSWPLDSVAPYSLTTEDTKTVLSTEDLVMQRPIGANSYTPSLLSNMSLAMDYATLCIKTGIEIRVLLCLTMRSLPIMSHSEASQLLNSGVLLGFDYAYSSCTFSALYSDLTPPPTPLLEKHRKKLNAHGLLSSWDDLVEYTEDRWSFIRESQVFHGDSTREGIIQTELEDFGDFLEFQVFELDTESLWTVLRK